MLVCYGLCSRTAEWFQLCLYSVDMIGFSNTDDDTILFASGMTQGGGLTEKESGDLAVICDAWYCMWYVDEDGYNEVSQQRIVMERISSFLCVKR